MPFKEKKRQKTLLVILAVVIVIAGFVLYNSQRDTASKKVQQAASGVTQKEKELKEIKLELEVLDNKMFQYLKSFGVLPVIPGDTGRENPFQP